MSINNNQNNNNLETKPQRRRGGGGGRRAMPVEKAKDFKGTLKRLIAYLKPQAVPLLMVIIFTTLSVIFTIFAPRIMGEATNELFEGVMSKYLPADMTKEQAIAELKAKGQDQLAEMLSAMDVTPGKGVDFNALLRILLILLTVYLLAAFFQWLQQYTMAGVAQNTVYRLRRR